MMNSAQRRNANNINERIKNDNISLVNSGTDSKKQM